MKDEIKEKLLKEIREELDRGITRNKFLPLDWAMDRIEPILMKAIEETSKAKDEEFKKWLKKIDKERKKIINDFEWIRDKYDKLDLVRKINFFWKRSFKELISKLNKGEKEEW